MAARLTRRPLSLAAAEARLAARAGGGVVVFAGRVRPDPRRGSRVVALDYEVHPAPARAQLQAIEREARRRFGAVEVVLWHRLGRVPVGEISVVTGAACAHRAEAFAAARYLIDRLKETVPIWKEERRRRGRPPRRRPSRRTGPSAG